MINSYIYNKVKKGAVKAGVLTFSLFNLCALSSCNDFLDLLPMNEVVLENYWTQKSDVTSVLMGCYNALENKESIIRMGVWGELRSDNLMAAPNVPWEVEQVLKENLLSTGTYSNWSSFYTTINRCNTLCYYAPMVQAKDPNYQESEMKANVAEAVAIRSLCYFYLARTFRDVPYVTEPTIDDTKPLQIPATSFEEVLKNIAADLEKVKDDAVRRYYLDYTDDKNNPTNPKAYINSSRITRSAIYTLLADIYLWLGEYQKAVDCCQYVLDYKIEVYNEMREKAPELVKDIHEFGSWPLIVEDPNSGYNCGNAYNQIFGKGHSFESIFELDYDMQSGSTNSFVHDFYGRSNNNSFQQGSLAVPTDLYGSLPGTPSELYLDVTDCRAYANINRISTTSHAVGKYVRETVSMNMKPTINETSLQFKQSLNSGDDYNWIIYRLTDVMLIQAEAYVQLGELEKAYDLVDAVYSRSNNILNPGTGALYTNKATYTSSQTAMSELVMSERHREFMFEGKRWYDLVREARRNPDPKKGAQELAKIVVKKQIINQSGITVKLSDPNALYWPYSRSELRVNPNLHQNPAFTNGADNDFSKN